jgi:hypothetical protein
LALLSRLLPLALRFQLVLLGLLGLLALLSRLDPLVPLDLLVPGHHNFGPWLFSDLCPH